MQCVQDLRGLMEEVATLKAERETIERTLRDNVADISECGENTTVEPPNRGRFGTAVFVLSLEVVLFLKVV